MRDEIIRIVCENFNTSYKYLYKFNKDRHPGFVLPRQMIFLFLKYYTNMSLAKVGAVFEKDHSTAYTSIETINGLIFSDKELADTCYDINKQIIKELNPIKTVIIESLENHEGYLKDQLSKTIIKLYGSDVYNEFTKIVEHGN